MRPRITILEAIHPDGVDRMAQFAEVHLSLGLERAAVLDAVAKSDAVVVKSVVQVDGQLFKHAPKLQVVGRAGTGVDNIDLDEAQRRGIAVHTVPAGNSISGAEYAVGQILSLCRRFPEAERFIASGDFRRHLLEGRELQCLTVGLVGLGRVGLAVAERLAPFGCKLLGYDPGSAGHERFIELGGELVDDFESMLPRLDLLSFHARLTSDNRHMLGRDQFSKVRSGLLLVNSARAALIDEEALLEALNSEQIGWAALDVLDPEPPFDASPEAHNYSHPLLAHPRVTVTPHMAASTLDAQRRIAIDLAEQLHGVLIA